jgi:hypothetical protein
MEREGPHIFPFVRDCNFYGYFLNGGKRERRAKRAADWKK